MKKFYNPYRPNELDEEKLRQREAEKQENKRKKQEKDEERYRKHKDYKYLANLPIDDNDREYIKDILDKSFSAGLDQVIWTKVENYAQINMLEILVQQNWMIIKQLNEINKKLDK